MGRIGEYLSRAVETVRDVSLSRVKAALGGGETVVTEHFQPPGEDSAGLPGDWTLHVRVPRSGGYATLGVVTGLEPKAGPGEVRRYARDEDGAEVVSFWLKSDGSAIMENENGRQELRANGSSLLANDNGAVELKENGEADINGARITTDGDVITSDGISLRNHFHNQANDAGGDTEQPTETPEATE